MRKLILIAMMSAGSAKGQTWEPYMSQPIHEKKEKTIRSIKSNTSTIIDFPRIKNGTVNLYFEGSPISACINYIEYFDSGRAYTQKHIFTISDARLFYMN